MKAITQTELASMLSSVKGATFATITTVTDARLKKTGNPFGAVSKVSRVNVTLGFQYEGAVNRQRAREGEATDFEAQPRKWGERVQGTFLVKHKGKVYLETKVERSLGHEYMDARGATLTADQVAPYLPSRSKPATQGTEKEIMVRDYALDSILHIRMKGEDYIILGGVPAPIRAAVTI